MGALIRILIALFLLLWAQPSAVPPRPPLPPSYNVEPPATPELATTRVEIPIESVTQIVSSSASRLDLNVIGYHDGCDFPVLVDQRQEGHDVYVTVYRQMPSEVMCPMVLIHYNQTIHLDGTFVSGETYTIHVNDYVLTVTV